MCASSAFTSVPLVAPWAGCVDHAGRLIDHEQVVVFIYDRDFNGFGERLERLARHDLVGKHVTVFKQIARLDCVTVDAHCAAFDRIGDERTRRTGKSRDQNVGARSRLLRRDGVFGRHSISAAE